MNESKRGRVIRYLLSMGILIVVTAFDAVAQQSSNIGQKLKRCEAAGVELSKPIPLQGKDSAAIAENLRLQGLRRDSVRMLSRACLADIEPSAVPDSLLGTLINLQRSAGENGAIVPVLYRMARMPGKPLEQRYQAASDHTWGLPNDRSIQPLFRLLVAMADSIGNPAAQIEERMRVVRFVRATDTLSAYRELQTILDFLGTLDARQRAALALPMANLVSMVNQWEANDKDPFVTSGFVARVTALLGGSAEFLNEIDNAFRRAAVVGTRAIPFESPRWLNVPATVQRNEFSSGKVTLVEFTSEYCLGCKLSYKPIQAMYKELAAQGFDALFCIPNEGPGSALLDRYRELFKPYGIEFPVMVDETAKYVRHYTVSAIPHFLIVDRKGVVRDMFLGWDGDRVRKRVLQLLAEDR